GTGSSCTSTFRRHCPGSLITTQTRGCIIWDAPGVHWRGVHWLGGQMMKPALFSLLFVLPCLGAESFGGAQIAEVYRVRLDRGDLLLESIQDFMHKHGIADGAVLTAAGSLQECTFH